MKSAACQATLALIEVARSNRVRHRWDDADLSRARVDWRDDLKKPDQFGQRMTRPHDARAVRSREALKAAVLELVEVKTFEQITIKEITLKAGVSYPVFFRRYASKDEIFEDIAAEEVRRLFSHTLPVFDQQGESFDALCNYVEEHRALWTALLTTGAASALRSEFRRISAEISQTRPRRRPWLPGELAAAVTTSNIFEILSWWLSQPADYPRRNVVTLLDALVVRALVKPGDVELI